MGSVFFTLGIIVKHRALIGTVSGYVSLTVWLELFEIYISCQWHRELIYNNGFKVSCREMWKIQSFSYKRECESRYDPTHMRTGLIQFHWVDLIFSYQDWGKTRWFSFNFCQQRSVYLNRFLITGFYQGLTHLAFSKVCCNFPLWKGNIILDNTRQNVPAADQHQDLSAELWWSLTEFVSLWHYMN